MANQTGLEDIQAHLPLGQASNQPTSLDASVLVSVPRALAREVEGVDASRFVGQDLWNCWEISWLTLRGLPAMRIGQLVVPADSPNLCESKSLKLYFNSFANTLFDTEADVISQVVADLTPVFGVAPTFRLFAVDAPQFTIESPKGECLDQLPVNVAVYEPDAALLQVDPHRPGNARWYTHLFRSNCPVTAQPDWATVVVKYQAPVWLIEDTLLAYLVSYRNHTGFHEACIERIYQDLLNLLQPTELVVWAGFVRRGGLDINPVRSLIPTNFLPPRLTRH
jgi:7-cyano-7-deazaguanine reductase